MEAHARKEGIVLGILIAVLLVSIFPSALYARRERRDGIRRDEVAAFKRQLEDFNNKHNRYPVTLSASPHQYVVVEQAGDAATAWYLRAELENKVPETADKDLEAERNYYYRVVHDNGHVYYDVCGGTLTCGVE